jgi:hypothetical protein
VIINPDLWWASLLRASGWEGESKNISINFLTNWPSMGKPSQSHFFQMGKPSQSHSFQMSMFMCFINLYHVQNILCKGHHSISNILWVITFLNVGLRKLRLGKKWFLDIFEVWIKLYWNTINLGATLRHFWIYFGTLGCIKCIGGASILKKKKFPFFSEFCLASLVGFSRRRSQLHHECPY